jgi:HAD superfamily hydrolase (TIGR01509 family)
MKDAGADIEVFVFDLFGVMLSFDNDIVYSRFAQHCAHPEDAFVHLHGLMSGTEVITGRSTLPQIYGRLVDTLELSLSYPEFEAAWLAPYSEAMPGMADLVKGLSAHYRLLLLSNVDRYYWQVVLPMHPELECFESLLVSCDIGMAKPNPGIFRHICQVCGVTPSRCYFIDDTELNVAAASALGFQTHWFHSVAGLERELARAKVKGL